MACEQHVRHLLPAWSSGEVYEKSRQVQEKIDELIFRFFEKAVPAAQAGDGFVNGSSLRDQVGSRRLQSRSPFTAPQRDLGRLPL